MRDVRGLLFVLVPIIIIFVIFSFLRDDDESSTSARQNGCTKVTSTKLPTKDTKQTAPTMTIDPSEDVHRDDGHQLRARSPSALDAKTAPIATNNFVSSPRPASTTACRSTGSRRTS